MDDRHAVMGANSRQWSETMRRRLDLELTAEEIEQAIVEAMVERYAREGAPSIDGAVATVRRLAARWPLALASSSHPRVIAAALSGTGLADAFRVVVSSDEVEHGKPAPDVFLEAGRRLGITPADILVVEDSLNGLKAGRAAGMTTVLVPNRSVPPASGSEELADIVLDQIGDLDPAAIDRTRQNAPAAPRSTVPTLHPVRRLLRAWVSRIVSWLLVRAYLRPRLIDRRLLPKGPAIYCFNHLNWADPFILMGTLPMRPRLTFFGPKEEDMSVGGRNRLMIWTGATIPYRPGKNDLLEATRRVVATLRAGGVVAIAGEGRIQPFESTIQPLNEGAAYFALRAGVPMVPIAINGTSWLCFGRRVRIRIGEPLVPTGRPTRQAVDELTARCRLALEEMVAAEPEYSPPGPFGRCLTELFNDWPEGDRAAAEAAGRAAAAQRVAAGGSSPAGRRMPGAAGS